MQTVNEAKEALAFNGELKDLLEAMKDIAVFQFHALQRKKGRFVAFTKALASFFQMIDMRGFAHPFANPATDRIAIIAITSDEGFVGGLNFQIIDSVLLQRGAAEGEIIIVGEKGQHYLEEMGRKFTAFKGVDLEGRYKLALELKDYVAKGVREGRFGVVDVCYADPVSFMIQRIGFVRVLPISAIYEWNEKASSVEESMIIESPLGGIVEYLAEQFVFQRLTEILEDSKLSEYAARAIHLERSNRELTDKEKALRFKYFRAYHESIDRGTREIFSAQLIQRKLL